jgi:hypothetical protein
MEVVALRWGRIVFKLGRHGVTLDPREATEIRDRAVSTGRAVALRCLVQALDDESAQPTSSSPRNPCGGELLDLRAIGHGTR